MDISGDPAAAVNSINCHVYKGKPLALALSHSNPLLAFPSCLFNPFEYYFPVCDGTATDVIFFVL
jgi:hypothetical protein